MFAFKQLGMEGNKRRTKPDDLKDVVGIVEKQWYNLDWFVN